MALIAMAVHDTEDNGRSAFTKRTLLSLTQTVNWKNHRLFIIDNGSCKETKELISEYYLGWNNSTSDCIVYMPTVITNDKNIGTAEAINLAWKHRQPNENCIKMDNDVIIHSRNWVEKMEEAISREPKIGIIGLKRKDLIETPWNTNIHFRSQLLMLPHEEGQKWILVEKCKHIMGTCQMYSAALLDKIGYLCQPDVYGFDDSYASYRSSKAGYINVFLPHIEIDHIDPGGTPYSQWKREHASEHWQEYEDTIKAYESGKKDIYYNPFK